jgi:hypothetical protein
MNNFERSLTQEFYHESLSIEDRIKRSMALEFIAIGKLIAEAKRREYRNIKIIDNNLNIKTIEI